MNPFRKIANSLMNWWKGETAPEVSDSTELTGGVMTLNSPSFLESMGLSRRRRNAMILKVADEMTKGKEVVISTIDSLKDVFNVGLDPAIAAGAMVVTNQNGYNYLDKLKDKDGKYILQPNPTQPTRGTGSATK